MKPFFNAADARTLATLAIPVFLAQIAQVSMGFVDTVVAGRAGDTDMAAVAVASSFWFPAMLFGQGLIMAITPLVAQAIGAGNREGLGRYLRQGAWLALVIAVFLMAAVFAFAEAVLHIENIEPRLAKLTSGYLRAIVWGVPGLMLYCAIRSFLDGQGRTRPAMLAGLAGLLVNIPLNFVFVFGLFGAPALGGVGCGVASAVVCWIMFLVMLATLLLTSPRVIRFERFSGATARRILRIGLPGAFALLMETSSFALIAVLIAPLGAAVVAGHQVAINVSGLIFMLPFSVGAATTIRVGTRLGEGDLAGARSVRRTALTLGLILAVLTAVGLLVFRYPIARVYTDSLAVVSLAALLLMFDAIYQLSDAAQVITIAALRGYNDTRAIFGLTFVSYWFIGLPLGCALGLTSLLTPEPLGVAGFWIAIIAGLTCAAALSYWRLRHLESLPLEVVRARISR